MRKKSGECFINLCYDAEDIRRMLDVEVKAEIGLIEVK